MEGCNGSDVMGWWLLCTSPVECREGDAGRSWALRGDMRAVLKNLAQGGWLFPPVFRRLPCERGKCSKTEKPTPPQPQIPSPHPTLPPALQSMYFYFARNRTVRCLVPERKQRQRRQDQRATGKHCRRPYKRGQQHHRRRTGVVRYHGHGHPYSFSRRRYSTRTGPSGNKADPGCALYFPCAGAVCAWSVADTRRLGSGGGGGLG